MIFSISLILKNSACETMTNQKDKINLGKIVFDNKNQGRKFWDCLGQTCSRSLIVLLSQLFVILLIVYFCFWRLHLSKICDESTVLVGILCKTAGYILLSPRLWTSYFLQKIESFFGWSFRNWKNAACLQSGRNGNISTKVWQILLFLSTFPTSFRCYAKRIWKSRVCAWSKLWIYWFVKKQRYKVLVNFGQLLWRDLQFKGLWWPCHRWETLGSEHNLQ